MEGYSVRGVPKLKYYVRKITKFGRPENGNEDEQLGAHSCFQIRDYKDLEG